MHVNNQPPENKESVSKQAERQKPAFPFTAIVGQEELKLALQLCVTDPTIGGVLVMGHRGTAKSTAVRSLAALLPRLERVAHCPYNCDPADPSPLCPHCGEEDNLEAAERVWGPVPVVDLPLGATEDRVAGSLDVEKALVDGVQAFAPGLLARANRGFLYIDEVNLLEDHLVDLLLDVAASGVNVVEREGISIRHPARFVLVGSGNPEEGDLRPQLLDRFGLHARIQTIVDIDERVEIVRRRRAYDADPQAFAAAWEPEQEQLRSRLAEAQRNWSAVELTDETIETAARLCVMLEVDGHRGELTLCRSAVALAALEGRSRTEAEDVARVAKLSLLHRLRKDPLEAVGEDARVERAVKQLLAPPAPPSAPPAVSPPPVIDSSPPPEPAAQKGEVKPAAAPRPVGKETAPKEKKGKRPAARPTDTTRKAKEAEEAASLWAAEEEEFEELWTEENEAE